MNMPRDRQTQTETEDWDDHTDESHRDQTAHGILSSRSKTKRYLDADKMLKLLGNKSRNTNVINEVSQIE